MFRDQVLAVTVRTLLGWARTKSFFVVSGRSLSRWHELAWRKRSRPNVLGEINSQCLQADEAFLGQGNRKEVVLARGQRDKEVMPWARGIAIEACGSGMHQRVTLSILGGWKIVLSRGAGYDLLLIVMAAIWRRDCLGTGNKASYEATVSQVGDVACWSWFQLGTVELQWWADFECILKALLTIFEPGEWAAKETQPVGLVSCLWILLDELQSCRIQCCGLDLVCWCIKVGAELFFPSIALEFCCGAKNT